MSRKRALLKRPLFQDVPGTELEQKSGVPKNLVCNLRGSALLRSFALFCALFRSFALFRGLAFALFCAHLRSFACFCERPRLGTPEHTP